MHSNHPEAPSLERRKQTLHRYPPNSLRVDTLYYPGCPAEPDDICLPCLKLRGLWMQAAGFEIGARVKLDIKRGCILLTVQESPAADAPKVRKMGRLQLARLQAQEAARAP
ncbi:SymE family type I addiction module toxin [Stenotrophomonas sp. PD6]|uniref:SymE family type I addiction module toxin n=1 Tax=Stenotrophomonas sp. PD6 TaxID=3368612 RepID=UPI003BA05835